MQKPLLTFQMLRLIAEYASGVRNQDLWFVVRNDSRFEVDHLPVVEGADTVVIHCSATNDPPSRVSKAVIASGSREIDLLKIDVPATGSYPAGTYAADAVFWTVSAVEKFMVPYYASVYGDQAPRYVEEVLRILFPAPDMAPVAPGMAPLTAADAPFAVAHLPSSEYVGEPYVPHVVSLHPSGARLVPLKDVTG